MTSKPLLDDRAERATMKRIVINRLDSNERFTAGVLLFGDLPKCETLELPWRNNAREISCIPGNVVYKAKYNPAIKRIEVFNVVDRDSIQIHAGNKLSEIAGCILVGGEVEPDTPFIYDSQAAFNSLVEIVGEEIFELAIVDPSNTTTFYKSLKVVSGKPRRNGESVTVSDPLPEPPATIVNVKVNWLQKLWATNGLKRIAGAVGIVTGVALLAFGIPAGEQVIYASSALEVTGLAHAIVKTNPANGAEPNWFWRFVQALLDWLKAYIGDNVK